MQSLRSFLAPLVATVIVFVLSASGCGDNPGQMSGGAGGTSPGPGSSSNGSGGGSGGQNQGGGGNQSTSQSAGGGDGGASECNVPADCTQAVSECEKLTCIAGKCGKESLPAGTVTSAQNAGDCKQNQCDGSGKVVAVNDNSDTPDDKNDCTDNVCVNGAPSNPPLSTGSRCGSGMKLFCDGQGKCVGCVAPSDCSGEETDCQTRTCTGGSCGLSFASTGTPTTQQKAGDCQQKQCDGNGGVTSASDNGDRPFDGNDCTDDVCTAGVASNPPLSSGAQCNQNNGAFCNGGGACVECVVASTCPGQDTDCQKRTCDSGACKFTFTMAGTATQSQTPGDCKESQCDGSGGVISVNNDSDRPVDGKECTADVCTAGLPSNPPVTPGTSCGPALVCNASGACVGCFLPSDCPGQDTECQTRSCTNGTCGFTFAAAGTPVAAQAPGDCKENQCNGAGAVVVANKDSDRPIDGNDCTNDVCTAGVPSNPPSSARTSCSQGGGTLCDGIGDCVACLASLDCPGQDTDCQIRACNNGVCGVTFTPANTPTSSQTAGDCKQNRCDGSGGVVASNDDTDIPADNNACTSDTCTGGVQSNSPVASGSSCNQNGGVLCDSTGACVACLSPSDCQGVDTECQARSCASGVCGLSFTPAGTPTQVQKAGDCQQNRCNGSGSVVGAPDNNDVPADGDPCTADLCSAGVPSNPPLTVGASCGPGLVCDASGACVGCVSPSDCPGADNDCQTRTCTSGTCGLSFAAAGTPTAQQTPGDCRRNECDGAGNKVNATDDADFPNDNNQCTDDLCTAGVPSHASIPSGAACNQNGGLFCNGVGACVECLNSADCASSVCLNNACQAPSCGDAVKNQDETDTDCGGSACPACAIGKACGTGNDCTSGRCVNSLCSDSLVLSEIQTRGDIGGNDEFVEIYNPTSAPVAFDSSWTVSARSAVGTCAVNATQLRFAGKGEVIPPHGHLLYAFTGTGGYNNTTTPANGTYTTGITDSSSVILKHGNAVVDAVCFFFNTATQNALLTCSTPYICEGTPVSNLPHDNTGGAGSNVDRSLERKPRGTAGNGQDTNVNANDFVSNTPSNPQNLASTPTP